MPVVLILLMVLLGLLLLALLVAVLLLSVRTGVEAVGVNGEVSVELRYGMVRIPIWPPPQHRKEDARHRRPARKKQKRIKDGSGKNTAIRSTGMRWTYGKLPIWRCGCWAS